MSLLPDEYECAPVLVLDTNILRANPFPGATLWQRLAAAVRSAQLQVVIPEVVLRESARHRRQQMNKDREELRTALATIKRKLGPSRADPTMFTVPESAAVDAALAEFTQSEVELEVREEIAKLGFVVAPLSAVSQDEMLDWSLSSEPPFDNSDKGYRDALAWFSFCDVAREYQHTSHEVVLVSADNDFGPGAVDGVATFHERLQRHLVEQCLVRGTSISKRVDPVLERLPKLAVRETLSAAARGEMLSTAVEDQCLTMADQPLFWETADMEVEGWVDNLELPSVIETLTLRGVVPQIGTISVDPAETYEDSTEVGTVTVTAAAEYDGFIYKHELEDVADKVEVLDGDWNDHLMHVGGRFATEIEFSYVITQSSVEGMDLKRIRALG